MAKTYSPITLGRVVRVQRAGPLTVTQAQHAPGSSLPMHAHERPNLTLVLSGGYAERMATGRFLMGPHEILIKAAGERHSNDYGGTLSRSLTIEMDPEWVVRVDRLHGLLATSSHVRSPVAASSLLRVLGEMVVGDETSSMAIEELVLSALGDLVRLPLPTRPSWIPSVRAYVEENWRQRISLTNVAETFELERSLLARAFKRDVGTTIGAYLRMVRVQHACRQLVSSSRSIANIAAQNGFADQAHLCRVFKLGTGMTPTEFRRCAPD